MEGWDGIEEDLIHFDQTGTLKIHQLHMKLLKDSFTVKRQVLQKMNLKSLSLDFSDLFCDILCCSRKTLLESCLGTLDWTTLWSGLEQDRGSDLETKLRTDVRICGLNNDEEKRLVWETWGLKVD